MDIGLGEGCTSGKDNEVGGIMVFRDGVRGVDGEDMNDDGSEYTASGSLHSVHESNFEDVSQWLEFNTETDMGVLISRKGFFF